LTGAVIPIWLRGEQKEQLDKQKAELDKQKAELEKLKEEKKEIGEKVVEVYQKILTLMDKKGKLTEFASELLRDLIKENVNVNKVDERIAEFRAILGQELNQGKRED